MSKFVLGITGASGSPYAAKLTEALLEQGAVIHLVCTDNGKKVFAHETGLALVDWAGALAERTGRLVLEDNGNLFSSIASGSNPVDAVVIIPCSMSTLGEIVCGTGKTLLCRVADVALKEGRRLLIVPRETPLNAIHLENMLKLARMGAGILPAMPGFYNKPQTLDDAVAVVAGKALDWLGMPHNLTKRWEEPTK